MLREALSLIHLRRVQVECVHHFLNNLDQPFPVMQLISWIILPLLAPYLDASTNQDILVEVGLLELGGRAFVLAILASELIAM